MRVMHREQRLSIAIKATRDSLRLEFSDSALLNQVAWHYEKMHIIKGMISDHKAAILCAKYRHLIPLIIVAIV